MEVQTNTPQQKADASPIKHTLLSGVSPALRWALLAGLGLAFIIGIMQFIFLFRII